MMSISGAFSSLGINESSHSSQGSPSVNRKYPQNCSTVSLPNIVLSERPKFVRNVCEEKTSTEQPVDFSKKYPENARSTFKNVVKNYNSSFTMYAETDLDQPTDYSLRYAEDDSDSDRCSKIIKTETTEFVQDTVKTYCTEDTPYETPFNFSTSTSMSDLRIDDKTIDVKLQHTTKDTTVLSPKEITTVHQTKIKSEFSSGMMSPEKPVNYCEEGTPGYFSRVASCGSLNSIPVSDPPKQATEETLEVAKKEPRRVSKFPAEAKAVKFEEVVNYAEQTPLMFSRTSSLASLDSIEQHSIHDDRSSVVSDFSRLTSGVISPSELPDSPSQTVPPSPKPRKTVIVFPTISKEKTEEVPKTTPNVPKSTIFEDDVQKFKVESTPLHFSSGTSLSSLIDDDIDSKRVEKNEQVSKKEDLNNLDLNLSDNSDDEDILAACINMGMQSIRCSDSKVHSPPLNNVSPIYNNFPKNSETATLNLKVPLNKSPLGPIKSVESIENQSLRKDDVTSDSLRTYCTEGTPAILSHAGSNSDLSILSMHLNEKNNLRNESFESDNCDPDHPKIQIVADFQTGHEEAPSDAICDNLNNSPTLEANNNNSRRSSLSLSDDSDESEQALLEECILAGMPKSTSPAKSLLVVIKTEDSAAMDNPNDTLQSDLSDDDDAKILDDCIQIGMQSNRYTNGLPKREESRNSVRQKFGSDSDVVNDTIMNYCTEDTPAILSHAGSASNLSVLSTHGSGMTNGFSDGDNEEQQRRIEVLEEETLAYIDQEDRLYWSAVCAKNSDTRQHKVSSVFPESAASDDTASLSSFSDSSYEADQALLQQCIQAGMPKRTKRHQEDSSELTVAEKALLQQCILDGMKKCRTAATKKSPEEDTSELTEAEEALLRQCIVSGMPKNSNLATGGPSASRESTELTESERLLLQQCILAGMPKGRNKIFRDPGSSHSRQLLKKPKEVEHTCCIHCPRNNRARQAGHVKGRRKYRERGTTQGRENRDSNIVYVASPILTIKKEVVDRTHENWV